VQEASLVFIVFKVQTSVGLVQLDGGFGCSPCNGWRRRGSEEGAAGTAVQCRFNSAPKKNPFQLEKRRHMMRTWTLPLRQAFSDGRRRPRLQLVIGTGKKYFRMEVQNESRMEGIRKRAARDEAERDLARHRTATGAGPARLLPSARYQTKRRCGSVAEHDSVLVVLAVLQGFDVDELAVVVFRAWSQHRRSRALCCASWTKTRGELGVTEKRHAGPAERERRERG
jgi:hypothetical protein